MAEYDLELVVEKVDPRARMPEYSDPEDAGLDVFACPEDENGLPVNTVVIYPGETKLVSLGIKIGIPEKWYLELVPRSGISSSTPIRIANSPGIIDTNFKGIVKAIVHNTSLVDSSTTNKLYHIGEKHNQPGAYFVRAGDKIAQLIPKRRYKAELKIGVAASIGSNRGGGFGHSGV